MTPSDQDIRNRLLVARLPAMPQILLRLLALCQADEASMAEMAKLIANDAGMAAKVLTVANSAAYNRGGQKVALVQALGTLGTDMLKTLVISESVRQTLSSFPYSGQIDLRMFWKHALGTALLARELAKAMQYAQAEEAYLAGLLHDVGRLALLAAAPTEYAALFYSPDNEALCAVELRSLEISHAEAGAWLVERWNLDSFMADAILYHHEPERRVTGAHPLIRIVHLAHALAYHDPALPLPADAGALCAIQGPELAAIHQGAAAQVQRAASVLGIDLSGLDDWEPPAARPSPQAIGPVQRVQEELGQMAVAAEVGQSFARQKDDTQLLQVIRQNAHVLFGLESTMVLLLSGNAQALVCVSVAEHMQRLAEFSVRLDDGGGIAQCALQQTLVFLQRKGAQVALAEDQLLRIFSVDCLLLVPLCSGGRCIGVLVAGVPTHLVDDLQRRQRFVQAYVAQAAAALSALANNRAQVDQRIAAIQAEHRNSAHRVRHEVNNPLAIIKNYLGVLDEKLARHEPVDSELGALHEEIDRVGHILGEFAGEAPVPVPAKVDLNKVIANVVRLFRESKFLPASVEIVATPAAQVCETGAGVDTLKQILINLIKNAVEAMPHGGRIEIINAGAVLREGHTFYALRVRDNGPGIPPAQRSRQFMPVQSTKAGANRGIGLSIVHGLVTRLGGRMDCQTSASGTEFEICLPASGVNAATAAHRPV